MELKIINIHMVHITGVLKLLFEDYTTDFTGSDTTHPNLGNYGAAPIASPLPQHITTDPLHGAPKRKLIISIIACMLVLCLLTIQNNIKWNKNFRESLFPRGVNIFGLEYTEVRIVEYLGIQTTTIIGLILYMVSYSNE